MVLISFIHFSRLDSSVSSLPYNEYQLINIKFLSSMICYYLVKTVVWIKTTRFWSDIYILHTVCGVANLINCEFMLWSNQCPCLVIKGSSWLFSMNSMECNLLSDKVETCYDVSSISVSLDWSWIRIVCVPVSHSSRQFKCTGVVSSCLGIFPIPL